MNTIPSADARSAAPNSGRIKPENFGHFKNYLCRKSQVSLEKRATILRAPPSKLYALAPILGLEAQQMAQAVAAFLHLPTLEQIEVQPIALEALSPGFCHARHVVPVQGASGELAFVLANPFHLDLLDQLRRVPSALQELRLLVADPAAVESLLKVSGRTPYSCV